MVRVESGVIIEVAEGDFGSWAAVDVAAVVNFQRVHA